MVASLDRIFREEWGRVSGERTMNAYTTTRNAIRKDRRPRPVSELQGIARFKFHEGKLEEFKRLSARCMEIVRTKDTGTLQYDIYFNEDQS